MCCLSYCDILSVWGEKGLTESKFQLERTCKQHAKCSDNESAG